METKICSKCKMEKPLIKFRKGKKNKLRSLCRDCEAIYRKSYYRNNIKHREKISNYDKQIRRKIRIKVMTHYSGGKPRCECCKEDNYNFLSIDHINGGGTKQRREGIASINLYRWLIRNNYPKDFRVLCMNCNQSYGTRGFCPHQFEDYTI